MSTKARANKAMRMMLNNTVDTARSGRTFDDCFEMGDGTAVVREIVRQSSVSPEIRAAVVRHGCSYWFDDPKYQAEPTLF